MPSREHLTLSERLAVLSLNVIAFALVNWWASDQILPKGGLESLWLFSGIAVWFLSLVTTPWFLPPRDVGDNRIWPNRLNFS